MKLTSVEVHPENSSEIAVLSFRDPNANNPYNVKDITGLDAEEIVPKYYGAGGAKKFYNLSLQRREIVVKVGLNPNFSEYKTYSDLRSDLYRMISSSRTGKVQLQFKNRNDIVAAVSGFILKFESPLFEKTQEIQFTIKCDEPLLKGVELIVLSELSTSRQLIEDNISTAPHGFAAKIIVLSDVSDLTIYDPDDQTWTFSVVPPDGFLEDDVIYFNSDINEKRLFVIREDETIQLADVISQGSIWPIIFPGENSFAFFNPESFILESIGYLETYWGV